MLLIQAALLSETLDPGVRELLAGSLLNNKRLEMMLSDILDLCLLEANKFSLNQDKFNVVEALEEIFELFKAQAAGKNIKLVLKDQKLSSIAIACSDRKRLTQVLVNLLSNAIKFTPSGGVVRLSAKEDVLHPRFLKFKVKDSGVGMTQEVQIKLREHLKEGRFKEKVSSSSSGAGIGLFLSNKLAVKLGQGISFFSEERKGSLFSFSLKNQETRSNTAIKNLNLGLINVEESIVIATEDKDLFDELPVTHPNYYLEQKIQNLTSITTVNKMAFSCLKPASQSIRGENQAVSSICLHPEVIIADDDPFNVVSLKEIIKKFNYETFVGYNGQDIVNYAEQLNAQKQSCAGCKGAKIIILDCNMPVMDGYTCVKELKKLMMMGLMPKIPVVACTAYIDQNEKMACRVYGFDDFLPKPVNVKKLKAMFDKYLSNQEIK